MTHTIINTTITFIISSILGYCVSLIRGYKKKLAKKQKNENVQNMALLTLLKSNLTKEKLKMQMKCWAENFLMIF